MIDYTADRPIAAFDTECYPNYWSLGFKTPDGRKKLFELWNDQIIGIPKIEVAQILRQYRIFGFFSKKYDVPMILLMMSGATNEELKAANDDLIVNGTPWWTFLDKHGLSIPDFIDHVDLTETSPGSPTHPSLKIYAGRLHSRKMQELPIPITDVIDEVRLQVLRAYHDNDLDVTLDLTKELRTQVALRAILSNECGVDVRSKSDAQVAEAVIKAELEKILDRRLYPPDDVTDEPFKYKVPSWVRFETLAMRAALGVISSAKFRVNSYSNNIETQDDVKKLNVRIGESNYQMGIGGLHSQESKISHFSDDDDYVLLDRDVTSYYPQTILLQAMYPKHLGSEFLKVYRRIYDRRVAAKRKGDKNTAETLKIVLNGVFGKLGNIFSIFYSPNLMIQVTLTGQLAILMLIEQLELNGIRVISANTDGIVSKVPKDKRGIFKAIFIDWEMETGYTTEETEYISVHSQSVNSYIALKKGKNGKIEAKRKGKDFTKPGPGQDGASGLKKNPFMEICTDAVIERLAHGTPIEETIEWCFDIRKFLVVNRVKGGAEKDDEYLGKALRWYYSTEERGRFMRTDNGNSVPKSEGAKLMLELKSLVVPPDLDHAYYIREAYALLRDFGVKTDDPRLRGRTGRIMVRHPDKKNIHYLDLPGEVALCGAGRESIRDSWVELAAVPEGHRLCAQCRRANRGSDDV